MTAHRSILAAAFKALERISAMDMRSISTIIGVIIGVGALTASFNFCETARRELIGVIEGMTPSLIFIKNLSLSAGSDALGAGAQNNNPELSGEDSFYEVSPAEEKRPRPITSGALKMLQTHIPQIERCSVFSMDETTTLVPHKDSRALAVAGAYPQFKQILNISMSEGRFFAPYEEHKGRRVCAITKDAAEYFFSKTENVAGGFIQLYETDLEVIGVIDQIENNALIQRRTAVFVPYSTYLQLTGAVDIPDAFAIRLEAGAGNEQAADKTSSFLQIKHTPEQFEIVDQKQLISDKKRMLRAIEWIVTSVSLLILLIAGIGCSNTMVLAVNQRRREIGIRRAVGATKTDIISLVLWEGSIFIMIGGVLGLALGFLLTHKILAPLPEFIPAYAGWQFDFTARAAVRTTAVLLLMSLVSSSIPAWRAAAMDPSQALKA